MALQSRLGIVIGEIRALASGFFASDTSNRKMTKSHHNLPGYGELLNDSLQPKTEDDRLFVDLALCHETR